MVQGSGSRKPKLALMDVATFAREDLGLHGLCLTTDLLAGASRQTLETLRERADKAACACLLLIEAEPQPFGSDSDDEGDAAIERTERVIAAAHVLGCNAAAIRITGKDTPEAFTNVVDRLKIAVEKAEKLELNLLLSPAEGITGRPERVTEIIKSVGRFRVMTLPDFERSAASPDPAAYLRKLTPYAGAVIASTVDFTTSGPGEEADWESLVDRTFQHSGYDLAPLVNAVQSVGFDGAMAIDYRGKGDVTLGLLKSRALLEAALFNEPDDAEEPEEGADDAEPADAEEE